MSSRIVLVLPLALACAACSRDWRADVAAWKPGAPLPASLPLVDETGRAFHLGDLAGEDVVVAFVFTNCPVADACPMTMSRLASTQELAAAMHAHMKFLVVTLDPARDTPAVLAQYGAKFHVDTAAGFTLATGDKDAVDALASLFNVVAVAENGTLSHPVKVALVDDKLVPVKTWTNNNFLPKEIVDAVAAQ